MLKLLGSIERVIILALLAGLFALTYAADSLKKKSLAANQTIAHLELALDKADQNNKHLAKSVALSEISNAKLVKERNSLAAINTRHSERLLFLNEQIYVAQQNIEKLRGSNDSTTKNWANHCVPDRAIGMLKYAEPQSCNRNDSTNTVQVPSTASDVLSGVRSGKVKF